MVDAAAAGVGPPAREPAADTDDVIDVTNTHDVADTDDVSVTDDVTDTDDDTDDDTVTDDDTAIVDVDADAFHASERALTLSRPSAP